MLRDCPLCPLSGEFLSQIGAEFCQKLFCIYWNDHMAFILQFVEMVYRIDLQMLKIPSIPGMNSTWSCCMIFLMYCWSWLLVFCWGFLYPCSSVILACSFFCVCAILLFNCHVFVFLIFSRQFGHSVMSDSLQSHGLQHARLPRPSPSPGVCSSLCSLSRWCHPIISSSFTPFSSCPQSFTASGSFPMNQLTASGGQSIGEFPLKGMFIYIPDVLLVLKQNWW